MKRYVGIDVSQEQCAICIVDENGSIMFEGTSPTEPDDILNTIFENAELVDKIVHESGPLSI